ncbi:MAG: anthranilate synthase component I [Verrucomicrobia bacterium]|nr:anthranilate synthase component I [Verrucomicrobiota bacterium]MCH8512193.1 anthranilate synthase component I [Kiritimatiellia bacterium]
MIHPDLPTFLQRARQGNLVPVVREILADQDTPVSAYEKLRTALRADNPDAATFLLESVEGGENIGRYSMLGGMPKGVVRSKNGRVTYEHDGQCEVFENTEPLRVLQDIMAAYHPVPDPGLPRFTGGAVGFLGYDCVAGFDKVPLSETPGLDFPEMVFLIADTVILFDQVRHTMKLVANAFIEDDPEAAYRDALHRIDRLADMLQTPLPRRVLDAHIPAVDLPFTSNTRKSDYLQAVEASREYIRAGDIIQVVLSQRFAVEGRDDPLQVYRALRSINPSPYMFCLELGDVALAGSSPEVHVRNEDRQIDIRPIAGTRKRGADEAEDLRLEKDLLADPKERAEHVMLVDLARNDIGRVCDWGSVNLTEFMIIERYSHVMHIVSNVRGTLREDQNSYDLMRATFPAGTLSGAPKIRAMEIIAELEPDRRGPYGGAVGYFGFDGNLDCCITIRTCFFEGNRTYVQAGAGLVADSVPETEFEETVNKAKGMMKALALARGHGETP